jgi:hypothetical protein
MSELALSRSRPQDGLIREKVNRVLQETGYAPLRCIQCDVSDGVVELTGSVPSFYIKRRCCGLSKSEALRTACVSPDKKSGKKTAVDGAELAKRSRTAVTL